MINIPSKIQKIVKDLNSRIDSIGCSGDQVIIYEDIYVLKISNDINRIKREKEKIDWINGKIPSPRSILFVIEDGKAYYLRTYIDGESLISEKYLNEPLLLINMLEKAFNLLKKLDGLNCPFNSLECSGVDFVHGDLCLPNILVKDNEISGFVDLENSGLGDRWYDYSWVLWSLEFNLKSDKYNQLLLEKLGIEFNQEKYEKHIPLENRMELKKR